MDDCRNNGCMSLALCVMLLLLALVLSGCKTSRISTESEKEEVTVKMSQTSDSVKNVSVTDVERMHDELLSVYKNRSEKDTVIIKDSVYVEHLADKDVERHYHNESRLVVTRDTVFVYSGVSDKETSVRKDSVGSFKSVESKDSAFVSERTSKDKVVVKRRGAFMASILVAVVFLLWLFKRKFS